MTAPIKRLRQAAALHKSCTNKRRFSDELTVRAFAQLECERSGKSAMGIYNCPACRGWHVTSRSHGRAGRVTAEHLFAPDPFVDLAAKE